MVDKQKYLNMSWTKEQIEQGVANYLEENFPHDLDKILLADGFEEAFVGVVESHGSMPKACYDSEKCIKILMENGEDMTAKEAVEYFEFNVAGAYVGESTPAFMHPFQPDWDCVEPAKEER